MDLNQQIFLEEEKHLNNVEEKLNNKISILNEKVKDYSKQVKNHISFDYDDVDVWRLSNASLTRYTEDREDYLKSVDEPYHARLDLYSKETEKIETYYIGKKGLYIDNQQLVLDWRTDIGMLLPRKTETNYNIDGTEYELLLRRLFDIKKSKLKYVNTEYDGDSVTLEGEVVDPFLIKVLKDKRRQNRLTDIIKTIQYNQNEIIRRPLDETFVVQGCAGSGKTMILLHRLSYLIFNNKNLDLSKTIIITPNKLFDDHVNELSEELGLSKISRYSVEEYYKKLINSFGLGITAKSEVISEKSLNSDLLSEIYSEEFNKSFTEKYHAYWEGTIQQLEELKLESLLTEYGLRYEPIMNHKFSSQSALENVIKECSTKIENKILEANQYDSKLIESQRKIDEAKEDLEYGKTRLESAKRKYFEASNKGLEYLSGIIEDIKKDKEQKLNAKKLLNTNITELEKRIKDSNQMSINDVELYSNIDFVRELDNDLARKMLEYNKELVEKISQLEQTFSKIPVYNFGKRNSVKKQITLLKDEFKLFASNNLNTFMDETHSSLEKDKLELTESYDKLNRISNDLDSIEENINNYNQRIIKIETENSFFIDNINRINRRELEKFTFASEAKKFLEVYKQDIINTNNVEYHIKYQENLIQTKPTEEVFKKMESDLSTLQQALKIIRMLSLSNISRNVYFKEMIALYKKYNQNYNKENYRHKLYLKLLLATLYGPKVNIADTFINIDEAQDIAVTEYRLMKSLLKKNAVFNLYGDVNQLVYSYKGIQDWCDIEGINMGNIYILNENYRNTTQITNYCNQEFNSEIYPIGISGEKVEEMDIFDALKWVKKIRKNNPNYRIAIVYRHGKNTVKEVLSQVLNDEIVSWFGVDDSKISILTVEEAKGLEFEVVIAIVDSMTDNEKYISYTRALSNLCVVRNVFEEKVVKENFDEKTIEENFDF